LECAYADLRTALSTRVLPSDQIAPGTLWLKAIMASNDLSIQLQSSSVMVSGGNSFAVCDYGALNYPRGLSALSP
jgi:hypothetical protein